MAPIAMLLQSSLPLMDCLMMERRLTYGACKFPMHIFNFQNSYYNNIIRSTLEYYYTLATTGLAFDVIISLLISGV